MYSLLLYYIDCGVFAIDGFSVVKADGTPIFNFRGPNEIIEGTVDKVAYLTLRAVHISGALGNPIDLIADLCTIVYPRLCHQDA